MSSQNVAHSEAGGTGNAPRCGSPGQAQAYAKNVTAAVVPCGHWVAEEIPEVLLGHLLPFLA
jgi:hypothetical protein